MAENCSRCGIGPSIGSSNTGRNGAWVYFCYCRKCGRDGPTTPIGSVDATIEWDKRQRLIAAAYKSNPPKMTTIDAATQRSKHED